MFSFLQPREPVWPEDLKPRGGGFNKEDFHVWWGRNGDRLSNLHPQLAEQWVYRHWLHSRFAFIPLDSVEWELISISGDQVLLSVHREFARPLDPEFDYRTFSQLICNKKHPTAAALDEGTWDYPIVTLSTPNGIVNDNGELPDVRLVLVEGHQRHRYLNALHAVGTPPKGPHKVFVVRTWVALG